MLINGIHIRLLTKSLGTDCLAVRGENVRIEEFGRTRHPRLKNGDRSLDSIHSEVLTVCHYIDEFTDESIGHLQRGFRTRKLHLVAHHVDRYRCQSSLQGPQHLVAMAKEIDHGNAFGYQDGTFAQ